MVVNLVLLSQLTHLERVRGMNVYFARYNENQSYEHDSTLERDFVVVAETKSVALGRCLEILPLSKHSEWKISECLDVSRSTVVEFEDLIYP